MGELDILTLAKRSIYSIFALISRTFILNIISFGAFLVISSQLPASVLGVYTAVIAIQQIISFFTDFGLGAALVQQKGELDQRDITTSFTIQSIVTFVIFFVIVALRPVIMSFFKLNDDAFGLLLTLVFSIFLSSFKVIPSILLERKINFQKLVIPQIAESLTFNIILVLLVMKGFGISSFTWAFLVSSLIGIPVYYYISPWKIRFGIYKSSLGHLKYGTQFQAKNVLATIKDNLLFAILPKFLSYTEIGYIGFAQRLAFFVFRFVVDSVTKVTFSSYARIQENASHLRTTIEKSLFFVSAVMFPILCGIIITAPYFIQYFPKWHLKWEPAILSLIFFCMNAGVSSLSSILVNVLDATGRVKTTLQLMVMWTVLTWILTPLLIYIYGYNGVAIASFLVTLTVFFTVYLVKKIIQFNFLKNIYKPLIATGIMSGVVYCTSKLIATNLVTLFFVILMGGAVYLFTIYLIARRELNEDIKMVFSKHE